MRNAIPMTEQMRVRVLQSSTMADSAENIAIPKAKDMLRRMPQKLRQSTPTSSWERTKPATMTKEQQTPPRNLKINIFLSYADMYHPFYKPDTWCVITILYHFQCTVNTLATTLYANVLPLCMGTHDILFFKKANRYSKLMRYWRFQNATSDISFWESLQY